MKPGTNRGINSTNGYNPKNWITYGKSEILETIKVSKTSPKIILGNGKLPEIEEGRNRRMASKRFFAAIKANNRPIRKATRRRLSSYLC